MSTKKMFWTDPYLTSLDTFVKTVKGDCITVEETIFYAQSGGQESDIGTIGGYSVTNAEKIDNEIVYTLNCEHSLKVGDKVTIIIDWERRYRLMRYHFAAEIVLELINLRCKPIDKIGAHISPNKARIDFIWHESLSSILHLIQAEARDVVNKNFDILTAFEDESNEVRFWKIDGFSKVLCGGTHVKKTGEVGLMTLKRVNIGKNKERVEINLAEGM